MTRQELTNKIRKLTGGIFKKKMTDVEISTLIRECYNVIEEEYDREDIITWLDENGIVADPVLVDKLYEDYIDNRDSDMGTWDNIRSSYYNVKGY